jgi:hypothetical protein
MDRFASRTYPDLFVIAPAGARDKAKEVVPVDATSADFQDPNVHFVAVAGTEQHEAALVVNTESGTTVVVNDLIWNVDDRPGFGGWLFRLAGFTGSEPKDPRGGGHESHQRQASAQGAARKLGRDRWLEPAFRSVREGCLKLCAAA